MIKKISMAAAMFVAVSTTSFAGGAMDHSSHSAASSKAGSGVHFYGRLYVGYDHKSTGQLILLIVSVIMDKNHD